MNRHAKRINPSLRAQIDTIKNRLRFAINPVWDNTYPFKQALKELKAEGVEIRYNKEKVHYYNPATVSKTWGYN